MGLHFCGTWYGVKKSGTNASGAIIHIKSYKKLSYRWQTARRV